MDYNTHGSHSFLSMSFETNASTDGPSRPARKSAIWKILPVIVLISVLVFGLVASPPGLLGKADAIGYAVCHRIESRSFHLGERQLPLCARCTGTFLGALAGAVILLAIGRGRTAEMPPQRVIILLVLTSVSWAVDGVNSYASLLPRLPHLYTPQNWLRLTTGAFLGLSMSAVFIPAVNQSLWKNPPVVPSLKNLREFVLYFLAAPALIGLVLTDNPLILYPLAVLSAAGILYLLTGVYAALLLMVTRREGFAESLRDIWPVLVAGLTLALVQIILIDIVRFHFTGTWGGFTIGG
jgi:uncharacterized membrane protein